jgi:hypothetical protein
MSFHDEPLVVDNGPLAIDVGQSHAETQDALEELGATWIRKVSQFNKIVVISKKGGGVNGEVETRIASLSREKPLTLVMQDNSQVTIEWNGAGHDELAIIPDTFRFSRNGNSRRLTQPSAARKIKHLTWFESATQAVESRFPETGDSTHESIFIGLYL